MNLKLVHKRLNILEQTLVLRIMMALPGKFLAHSVYVATPQFDFIPAKSSLPSALQEVVALFPSVRYLFSAGWDQPPALGPNDPKVGKLHGFAATNDN